jgi:hypothetical protein
MGKPAAAALDVRRVAPGRGDQLEEAGPALTAAMPMRFSSSNGVSALLCKCWPLLTLDQANRGGRYCPLDMNWGLPSMRSGTRVSAALPGSSGPS